MLKKTLGLLLALVLMVSMMAGCQQKDDKLSSELAAGIGDKADDNDISGKVDEDKPIVMGTNAEFPPFEFLNEKGEVDGFDAALAKEIAKDLGRELKIENMEFDSLLGALSTGKIDMAIAGMSIDETRLKTTDFSDPYFNGTQVIIVRADNDTIKGKDDLVGKNIGVQQGTTGDQLVTEIEGVTVQRFKKGLDAVLDLKNGKVDAVVLDKLPSMALTEGETDIRVLEDPLTEEEYAIGIKKGNTELVAQINASLKRIREDGTYDRLYEQYITNYKKG